jgi:hypothetical protein
MNRTVKAIALVLALGLYISADQATGAGGASALFTHAGQSADSFYKGYAYAIFPPVGKAGYVVGGAHGCGRVYEHGKRIGAVDFSEIVFFEDRHARDAFTAESYEFNVGANVVAITAAASASTGAVGVSEGASGGKHDAATAGTARKGVAALTIVKGGLKYDATNARQRFT